MNGFKNKEYLMRKQWQVYIVLKFIKMLVSPKSILF